MENGFLAICNKLDELKREINPDESEKNNVFDFIGDSFIVDYTYNSNAIEGNTLTREETNDVLNGIPVPGKHLDHHIEAINHRKALVYALNAARDNVPITEKFIKGIHSIVLNDNLRIRGEYRKTEVEITNSPHTPPLAILVPKMMKELLSEYKDSNLHPFEQSVLFHAKFEDIHPFADGNGRTGRLLLNMMLLENKYPPITINFIDRKQYYFALQQFHKSKSIKMLFDLLADYSFKSLLHYRDFINFKNVTGEKILDLIDSIRDVSVGKYSNLSLPETVKKEFESSNSSNRVTELITDFANKECVRPQKVYEAVLEVMAVVKIDYGVKGGDLSL